MNKPIRILAPLAVLLLLAGCKKDDSTTTLPTIYGASLSDPIPFVRVGESQVFTVDISGLYTSDNTDPGTLGLYWQLSGSARDTTSRDLSKSNPPYTVTADKTGTFTLIAGVYATNGNYYTDAVSVSFQAIDPETALSSDLEGTPMTIDGNPYLVTEAGGYDWMAINLYGTESGRDYRDCEVVSGLFGRYYSWEEAQTACPEGWRLPTAAEFDQSLGSTAGDLMVNIQFLDVDMWNYWPQVPITNALKFNAMPTGYMDMTTTQEVYGYKEYACWWTADENTEENLGVFRYIQQEEPRVMKGEGNKESLYLNVRCIRETD